MLLVYYDLRVPTSYTYNVDLVDNYSYTPRNKLIDVEKKTKKFLSLILSYLSMLWIIYYEYLRNQKSQNEPNYVGHSYRQTTNELDK